MTIHTRIPGINRRVPQTSDLLEYLDGIVEGELLERTKLVMAGNLDSESPGIVAEDNPALEDGLDPTAPLIVTVNSLNPLRVDVHPGQAVCDLGLRMEVTTTVVVDLVSTDAGGQNVVYLEYQNVESDLRPVRSRVTAINAKRERETDTNLVHVTTLAAYQALGSTTLSRVVALALVTIQATSGSANLTVVDMSQDILTTNRPWFSSVDMYHRKRVGSGTTSDSNPHGMTVNDFQVVGDLSLYDVLIGRGLVVSRPTNRSCVLGTLCTETIPRSRWVLDSSGGVTGYVNALYVQLLGYPIVLGSAELQDVYAGTAAATLLPLQLVDRTNIIFIENEEYRNIIIVGPGTDTIVVKTAVSGLADNVIEVDVSSGGAETVTYDAATKVLTVVYQDGVSTTDSIAVAILAVVVALPDFTSVTDTGTAIWSNPPVVDQVVYNIAPAGAVDYEVKYANTPAIEPPVDFATATTFTFGTPVAGEAVITEGLAFSSVSSLLTLDTLGPIPRRVWVVYDPTAGLVHIPQIVVPFTRLDDFASDVVDVDMTLLGPSKIRVWLSGSTPGSLLGVTLQITGTDINGASLVESVTFDSTWSDNPAGSGVEDPTQAETAIATFASVTEVRITARANDGPFSAVVVDAVPDFSNQASNIDRSLYVASFFWNGYRANDMLDMREVVPTLNHVDIPLWKQVSGSLLGGYTIQSAEPSNVLVLCGDDSDDLHNSDLILTQRMSLRVQKDTDDPTMTSADRRALDSWYYSRAMKTPNTTQYIQVTLLGDAEHFNVGGGVAVQYRYATIDLPDTWSNWNSFVASSLVHGKYDGTAIVFFAFMPDDTPGFQTTDMVHKVQLRMVARWRGYICVVGDTDLDIRGLGDLWNAMEVEHWVDPVSPDDGEHKSIHITPEIGANVTPKLYSEAHADDKLGAGLGNKQIAVYGWDGLGDLAPSEVFYINVNGDWWFNGGYQGTLQVDGDIQVTNQIFTDDLSATGQGQFDALISSSVSTLTVLADSVAAAAQISSPVYIFPTTVNVRVIVPINDLEKDLAISAGHGAAVIAYRLDIAPGNIAGFAIGMVYTGPVAFSTDVDWYWSIDIDPFIRSTCTIVKVSLVGLVSGGPAVTVEVRCTLGSADVLSPDDYVDGPDVDVTWTANLLCNRSRQDYVFNQVVTPTQHNRLRISHLNGLDVFYLFRVELVIKQTDIHNFIGKDVI